MNDPNPSFQQQQQQQQQHTPPPPPNRSHHPTPSSSKRNRPYRYSITGTAAHGRIAPLLPSHWIDCSPYTAAIHNHNNTAHNATGDNHHTTTQTTTNHNDENEIDHDGNDDNNTSTGNNTTQISSTIGTTNHSNIQNNNHINNNNNNNNNTVESPQIDFLWENAPRSTTRSIRDHVGCYSHLPNGIDVLDDKWVLARLFSGLSGGRYRTRRIGDGGNGDDDVDVDGFEEEEEVDCSNHLASLESYCFRGPDGFRDFCRRVGLLLPKDDDDDDEDDNHENINVKTSNNDDYEITSATTTPPPPPPSSSPYTNKKSKTFQFPDLLHRQRRQPPQPQPQQKRHNDNDNNTFFKTTTTTPLHTPFPPQPPNLWVIKDAKSNGAGGIWTIDPSNARNLLPTLPSHTNHTNHTNHTDNDANSPNKQQHPTNNNTQQQQRPKLLPDHRYVAQRYAWPPVLYGGKKCHVRVYVVLCADGGAYVHRRCFLHVANGVFGYGGDGDGDGDGEGKNGLEDDEVHLTNCCANSGGCDNDDDNNNNETTTTGRKRGKFAGEICADLNLHVRDDDNNKGGSAGGGGGGSIDEKEGVPIIPLAEFFPSISASVSELVDRVGPFVKGGNLNNGFEYMGLDFILSYRQRRRRRRRRRDDDDDDDDDGGGGEVEERYEGVINQGEEEEETTTTTTMVPIAYLLEVNCPPSQDTATGLRHAERLHNEVLRDLVRFWIVPCVMTHADGRYGVDDGGSGVVAGMDVEEEEERRGGWKCVVSPATTAASSTNANAVMREETETMVMIPSKAAILNKIRWAIFERKALHMEQQQFAAAAAAAAAAAVVVKEREEEENGSGVGIRSGEDGGGETITTTTTTAKPTSGRGIGGIGGGGGGRETITGDAIAKYARRQFPFFTEGKGRTTTTGKSNNNHNVHYHHHRRHHDLDHNHDNDDDDDYNPNQDYNPNHNQGMIFLENAGGTQVPQLVIQSMVDSLSFRHRSSVGYDSKVRARKNLLVILGAEGGSGGGGCCDGVGIRSSGRDVDEQEQQQRGEEEEEEDEGHVMFLGPNATTLLERLAQKYVESGFLRRDHAGGIGVGAVGDGDSSRKMIAQQCEIVIAADNHLANVTPWLNAARATGAVIRWWLCTGISTGGCSDDDDHLSHHRHPLVRQGEGTTSTTTSISITPTISTDLTTLLTPQTRIVTISHSSNLLGTVYDIHSIRQTVREICGTNAQIVVDGVALVPHSYASMKESGVDWYVLSCHKLFGPHIGGLCGRRVALRQMMEVDLVDHGGDNNGKRGRWKDDEELYREWEMGTVNYEACAGIDGLGVYLSNLALLRSDEDDHHDIGGSVGLLLESPAIDLSSSSSSASSSSSSPYHPERLPSGEVSEQQQKQKKRQNNLTITSSSSSPPSQQSSSLLLEEESCIQKAYRHIRAAEDLCVQFVIPRLEACPNVRLLRRVCNNNDDENNGRGRTREVESSGNSYIIGSVPIISFVHCKIRSKRIVETVQREGNIVIRHGTFLANDVLLAHLGLTATITTSTTDNADNGNSGEGIVRISFCHYNTLDEARQLMEILESIDGWW